ncbi:4-hydroxy-3-methylbut-2-enyl diphosphate reductase [Gammaproteobacteria bacterium]|nr:4-hydroxy-3-methylbut-2-enyl diphosphate reductase [Gammaproteobacteria bacterium]
MQNHNKTKPHWNIILANPRGFCAGVDRAVSIVEQALKIFDSTIYVHHEVVHNKFIVNDFIKRGVVFIDNVDEVPENNILIFSAHGVSQAIRKKAQENKLKTFDATCPLVTKVHLEIIQYNKQGFDCILIGHKGHPEVEGSMGQFSAKYGGTIYLIESAQDVEKLTIDKNRNIFAVTQTTLSVDDTSNIIELLLQKYPCIRFPKKSDICYATQNRQNAVKELAIQAEVMIVVGSVNSSNSNRLVELGLSMDIPSYLVDDPLQIQAEWLINKNNIGITAGASAPEQLVQQIVRHIGTLGTISIKNLKTETENVVFKIPKELVIDNTL